MSDDEAQGHVFRVFTADLKIHDKLSSFSDFQRDMVIYGLVKHLEGLAEQGFIEGDSYWQRDEGSFKMLRSFDTITPQSGGAGSPLLPDGFAYRYIPFSVFIKTE